MTNLARLLAAGALVASLATANANELNVTSEGFLSCGHGDCVWGKQAPSANPRVIHVQPRSVSAASEREWRERCRPEIYVDELNVETYRYAAAGCEFGPRR